MESLLMESLVACVAIDPPNRSAARESRKRRPDMIRLNGISLFPPLEERLNERSATIVHFIIVTMRLYFETHSTMQLKEHVRESTKNSLSKQAGRPPTLASSSLSSDESSPPPSSPSPPELPVPSPPSVDAAPPARLGGGVAVPLDGAGLARRRRAWCWLARARDAARDAVRPCMATDGEAFLDEK